MVALFGRPDALCDSPRPIDTLLERSRSRNVARVIVAISRFRVKADEAADLEQRFRERSHLVDGHEGFLGLEVLRSHAASPEFLLLTRWTNRAALGSYLRSAEFRKVHASNEEENAEFVLYESVAT